MPRKGILIFFSVLIGIGIIFGLGSLSSENVASGEELTIYHSSNCACCKRYARVMENKGFNVKRIIDKPDKRMEIMNEAGLPQNMASCHVSIADGYYFEGHIPAEVIKRVLSEKPKIDGLVLPDMPSGSPGMPGAKSGDWKIYKGVDGEFTEFITL